MFRDHNPKKVSPAALFEVNFLNLFQWLFLFLKLLDITRDSR